MKLRLMLLGALVAAGCHRSSGGGGSVAPVDYVFNVAKGFSNVALAAVGASDGSGDVFVAGSFTTYNRTATNRMVRLNGDGSVDPSFVNAGFNSTVEVVVDAGDGSGDLLVGGGFTLYGVTSSGRYVRLNADGTIDLAVGTGFNGTVMTIAPAGDGTGDVYVGGSFTTYGGVGSARIIRLNSDGSLDAAFVVAGFDGTVEQISPAADGTGDVYVGGTFTLYGVTSCSRIARLNADGSLDATFVVGTGFNGVVRAVTADGTGAVYAGGAFTTYQGAARNRIARLNADGTVDAGFAASFSDIVQTIVPAGDGSGDWLIGGYFFPRLARLNSDGTADASFAVGTGFAGTGFASVQAIVVDGDLFVAGDFWTFNGVGTDNIARLNADGSIDPSFTVGAGASSFVEAVAPSGDGTGDIYAAGFFTSYNGSSRNRIARLNADGTVDAGFAVGTGLNAGAYALAVAGGDVYVGGDFTFYGAAAAGRLVRLNADGSLDAGFALGAGFDATVRTIAPAADGSGDVYVGGAFTNCSGTACGRIVRLNSDGSIEAGFAVGAGFDNVVWSIVPAADGTGDVYVGGAFTDCGGTACGRIVRLNSSGSIDAGFATGAGFDGLVAALALDASGDVYAAGGFTTYGAAPSVRIIRLNSDGSVDAGFVVAGFNSTVYALSVDGAGVHAGGDFTSYGGTTRAFVARLNGDGSLDAGFVVAGFNSTVYALARGDDAFAELYVGGAFVTYGTATVDRLAALEADGSLE